MNVVVFPFGILAIAIGAGLLAVFVVWVSKRIADPQTRSQGFTVAALVGVIVVLGIFVTRVGFSTNQAPIVISGGHIENATTWSNGGRLEVRGESGESGTVDYSFGSDEPKFAWPRWSIAALVGGGFLLVLIAKKSLPAALAGLGLVAGLLLMLVLTHGSVAPTIAPRPTLVPPVAPIAHDVARAKDAASGSKSTSDITIAESPVPDAAADESHASPELEKQASAPRAASENAPSAEKNEPRPSWLDQNAHIDKATGEYRVAVTSGPYATEYECDYQLDDKIREAVYQYVDRHMGPGMKYFAWDKNYARQNLIEARYVETNQSQILDRPMVQMHALIKIDANDRRFFQARYHEAQVRDRVEAAGVGVAGVLGALALAYGALRFFGCRKTSAQPTAGAPPEPAA